MACSTQPANQFNENHMSKLEKGKEIAASNGRKTDIINATEEALRETKDDDKESALSSRVKQNHPMSQVIGDLNAKIKTRAQIHRETDAASTQEIKGSTPEKGQESESPNEKKPEPIEKGESSKHHKGQKKKGKKKNKEGGKKKNKEGESDEKDQYWRYRPLYKAALSGDWERAPKLIKQKEGRSLRKAGINWSGKTALHVAVGTGKATDFVEELVELMEKDEQLETDRYDNNALHDAALVGNTKAAFLLAEKRPDLLYICSERWKNFPVHWAAQNGHKETLRYLLDKTRRHSSTNPDKAEHSPFAGEYGVQLLRHVIFSGFYGVALDLVHWYPNLAAEKQSVKGSKYSPLGEIAKDVRAFRSGSRMSVWQSFIYEYVPVNFNDDCEKHERSDTENPAIENEHKRGDEENPHNSSQVTATTLEWNWARWAKEIFSISVTIVSQILRLMLSKGLGLLVGVPYIKDIQDQKLKHKQALKLVKCLCHEVISLKPDESESFARGPLLKAAELGIHEVVQEIVDFFPGLVWFGNIFNLAVTHRHENVFNLLYQMSDHKQFITQLKYKGGNNMLHLAAALAPPEKLSLVPGAALQMQRELQWFKAVEKLVNPAYKHMRNKSKTGERLTPSELFTKEHQKLVTEGEKWMKDTANACTIVAVLIVTVVFPAAITVPGGNKDESGLPIFSNHLLFNIFAVADTISLFTSTTSALLFLSILTSRYAESDFLCVLPWKLILGLVTLFFSITMMMVAFGSAIYLVFFQQKETWILIALGTLTCLPITSFMLLQFPLLLTLIKSTCRSIFRKQSDRPFH